MSIEPNATDFDSDEVSAALLGTWTFPITEPTGIGWLHFTNTRRAIQFSCYPNQRVPMRLWYSVESPTHLRFRSQPDKDGWLRGYRFDGPTLTLLAGDCSFLCTRPSPDEIPEWFHQSLASALTRP